MDTNLIVRIIVSVVTIVNLLAAQFGFDPLNLDEGTVYTIVSTAAAVVAWIWGFWKNNNFTNAAKKGQIITNYEKIKAKDNK